MQCHIKLAPIHHRERARLAFIDLYGNRGLGSMDQIGWINIANFVMGCFAFGRKVWGKGDYIRHTQRDFFHGLRLWCFTGVCLGVSA